MPKIERWDNLPDNIRQHRIDRMRDREISVADLNRLRLWIEAAPEVPLGDWYRDFGSFKICGSGSYPKTFLRRGKWRKANRFDAFSDCDKSQANGLRVDYALGGADPGGFAGFAQ